MGGVNNQDVDNANAFATLFGYNSGGLTAGQSSMLAGMGVDTGQSALNSLATRSPTQYTDPYTGITSTQYHPASWNGDLGLIAQAQNEGRYRQALGINTLQGTLAQSQLNATGQQIAQTNQSVLGSYDTAKNELDMAGQGAVRGLLANQKASIASAQQSLQGRGLGSTSVLQNAQSGIQGQTAGAIAGVQERAGSQRAGLAVQRGQMQQSLGNNLADFMKFRTQYEGNILQQRGDLIRGVTNTASPQATGNGNGTANAAQAASAAIGTIALIAALA